MNVISRRAFLRGAGSLVGLSALGADRWLAAGREGFGTALAGPRAAAAESLIPLFAEAVAELEKTFSYASVLFTEGDGISMARDRNGKQVSFSPFRGHGLSIRVWDGESFHEVASDDLSGDGIRAAVLQLRRDVAPKKERYRIEPLSPRVGEWKTEMRIDPASLSLEERAGMLDAEFERVNWDEPRVRSARVSTDESRVRRIFVDRNRRLASETVQISHGSFMFGFDAGRPAAGFMRHIRQGGYETARFSDADIETMRAEMVELFGAERVPAGEYDAIFAPPVTGLLAHESFGHGVEMDLFVKDRAKAREFIGKQVASTIVSLSDDPSIPGERGSYPFDDEGMLAQPTRVIERGIFVSPITDLMSATYLARPRTPNGRVQSFDRKAYARMSNTFIERGETDPAEMLAGLADGLYIDGFRNGIEDPQGWGIQFTAQRAREVKNGKFTGKVFTPITVSGYVPEILGNITQVGNDFEITPGSCGKGFKEFVPVGSGGPHIRTRARVS
ncbi:MAG: TldD/PmbA family protein [Candidatus Eisenbacteria bacterium]|nr:TldD/PmbA family protein [Candidatus Eisenbacteria bacterium]